MLKISS
jgi:hypothetical protein